MAPAVDTVAVCARWVVLAGAAGGACVDRLATAIVTVVASVVRSHGHARGCVVLSVWRSATHSPQRINAHCCSAHTPRTSTPQGSASLPGTPKHANRHIRKPRSCLPMHTPAVPAHSHSTRNIVRACAALSASSHTRSTPCMPAHRHLCTHSQNRIPRPAAGSHADDLTASRTRPSWRATGAACAAAAAPRARARACAGCP